MSDEEFEAVVFYEYSDEEPFEKIEYPVRLSEISHLYWDDDGLSVCVRRRASQEDYWQPLESRFANTREEIQQDLGMVELRPNFWVPVKNLVAVKATGQGAEVEIGDLHPEESAKSVAEICAECRSEYQRAYRNTDPAVLEVLNKGIEDNGGTAFLPGF